MLRAVTDVTCRVRATLVLAKRYREALAADGSAIKPSIRLIAAMNIWTFTCVATGCYRLRSRL
jgi:hypothetical protein